MSFVALAAASSAWGSDGNFTVRDVVLIDGTGAPPRAGVDVVVQDGRIAEIRSADPTGEPRGEVIEGRGRWLIPGLVDAHVHLSKLGPSSLPVFLANGVTTVRDMGSDLDEINAWRRAMAAGERVGPRIRTSGPMIETGERVRSLLAEGTVERVHALRVAYDDPADARRLVEGLVARGADYLKIRTFGSREAYFALGDAARAAGLPLVGHVRGLGPEDLLRSGQTSIEHFLYPTLDEMAPEARSTTLRRLAEAGVVLVPTLVVGRGSLFVPRWRAEAILNDSKGRIDPRRPFISASLLLDWREQIRERPAVTPAEWDDLTRSVLRDDRALFDAGVALLAGTDSAVALIAPGFALHDELELLVELLGLSPLEALQAATRNPARHLGLEAEIGTLEPGKRAEMVLLDADPLASISNTRRIVAVFQGDKRFDRAGLDALLTLARRAASEE